MRTRRVSQKKENTTAVLLKDFPIALHKAMKVEAIRRGRLLPDLYGEACTRFLRESRRRKGGEDS